MKKLPKGLKKEKGHKYILLKCLKENGKIIAKPGYIAILSDFRKNIFVCFVDQILEDIYPGGQSEIEIWGKWVSWKDQMAYCGDSGHLFWDKNNLPNEMFFIKPKDKNENN